MNGLTGIMLFGILLAVIAILVVLSVVFSWVWWLTVIAILIAAGVYALWPVDTSK